MACTNSSYAEIEGFPKEVEKDDFTAVVVHSDFERTASFQSSHKEVNQLYSNVTWGLRGVSPSRAMLPGLR